VNDLLRFVHPTASIGPGTTIGAFSVVAENVKIGEACAIGCGVVIHAGTRIGNRVRIDDHAVIGKLPMGSPRSARPRGGAPPPARIGDDTTVGTGAIVYAGAVLGERVLVADLASVREDVEIGDDTIVGRNVAVENRTTVGRRCKIETNAYVTALSRIGDDCFVGPEATFTNDDFLGRTRERFARHRGPTLEDGARIGANATVLPGRRIARDGLVAAGAVVTRDVPPRTVVMGVPARPTRPVAEAQLLENQ
jgi:acetyltransferase-like isoleucine patch superfamily enzyme